MKGRAGILCVTLAVCSLGACAATDTFTLSSVWPASELFTDPPLVMIGGSGFSPDAEVVILPGGPYTVGVVDTPGQAHGIVLSGNYLYLAGWSGGLHTIDISDLRAPRILDTRETRGTSSKVMIDNGFLYLLNDFKWHGLEIFDIGNPAAPRAVSELPTGSRPEGLHVENGTAFIGVQGGVLVVDVRNPLEPVPLGRFGENIQVTALDSRDNILVVADGKKPLQIFNVRVKQDPEPLGEIDLPGMAIGVTLAGDHAYVAALDEGLQIVSLADPRRPFLESTLEKIGRVRSVMVQGGLAYLAALDQGLVIVDVSDPSKPARLGSRRTDHLAIAAIVRNGYAFVSDDTRGLKIINVEIPDNPKPDPRGWHFETPYTAIRVTISGRNLFVSQGTSKVLVLDLKDSIGKTKAVEIDVGNCVGRLEVVGDVLYTTCSKSGLSLTDVSDPAAPVPLGRYKLKKHIKDLVVRNGLAYLPLFNAGMEIVDVSDPAKPRLAGSWAEPKSEIRAMFLEGDLAYLADQKKGLVILDLSNPATPRKVSSLQVEPGTWISKGRTKSKHRTALGVWTAGNYAYVSWVEGVRRGGVQVYDISDPASPERITSFPLWGSCIAPRVAGDRLYVADHTWGVVEIDISDPARPSLLTVYQTPGHPWSVAVAEGRIFVPDGLGVAAVPLRRPPEVVTVWKNSRIVARLPKLPPGPYHLRVRSFKGDEKSLMNGYVQVDSSHD